MTTPQVTEQIKDAWLYIFTYWNTNQWTPIPDKIKATLGLKSIPGKPTVGLYSGMLITEAGARGVQSFVFRLNHRKGE